MKFYEDIEKVIAYMEDNITDVRLKEIERLVGIPIGLFQRIFSYICGISIAEYTKKRRLSLACEDLIRGQEKILDIALTYGYQSHASFSRAFKELMGVAPSEVTEETCQAHAYPRFSFQGEHDTYMVVKGRRVMATLMRIEYEKQEEMKLIGFQQRTDFQHAGHMWQAYFNQGYDKQVRSIKAPASDLGLNYVGLGHMSNFDEEGNAFDYTIGKYFPPETVVPEGLQTVNVAEATIAHGQIKGTLNDILTDAYFLMTQAIEKNGYQVDYRNFYWCDVYTVEGFSQPMEKGEEVLVLDYYMPCIKVK